MSTVVEHETRPLDRDPAPTVGADTARPPTGSGAPAGHAPEAAEPDYVLWTHLGTESVFFYLPGTLEEHLVVEHGIPSVDLHWRVKAQYCDHEGDHRKQQAVRLGAIGNLLAITHAHVQAA